jgi:hypothetical protein
VNLKSGDKKRENQDKSRPCVSHEGMWGSGRKAPLFLNLHTGWRVISFTLQPLYPRAKCLWCPVNMRLAGTQSRSGVFKGSSESKHRFLGCPGRNVDNKTTALLRIVNLIHWPPHRQTVLFNSLHSFKQLDKTFNHV